jgi:hypothetical protein
MQKEVAPLTVRASVLDGFTAAEKGPHAMNPTAKAPSRFEMVDAELTALGIDIRRLPGEYRVNVRGRSDRTAYLTEDLDDALAAGRAMAARNAARQVTARPAGSPRRRRNRKAAKQLRPRWVRGHQKRSRKRPRQATK